jgi:hypothetical protein
MDEKRAYTHADITRVCLGNAWFEREWSGFLGHSVSLLQQPGDVEWMADMGSEFRLHLGGDALGIMEFGAVGWSEEQSPFGASVVAHFDGDALAMEIRTMALHEEPGMFRRVTLQNLTDAPMTLESAALELLPMEAAVCEGAEAALPSAPWEGATGFAVTRPGRHVLCAAAPGLVVTLDPEDGLTLALQGPVVLPAGQRVTLPEALLLLGPGVPAQSLAARFPAASNAVRAWKRWAAEREEA